MPRRHPPGSPWSGVPRTGSLRCLLAIPKYVGLPVSAVAARCGFAGPSHFTRRFRAAYGVTPREWRRLHHQDSARTVPTSAGPVTPAGGRPADADR
ncbi:helix-turn-helix domain-containing protein [Streptomyces sp. NPDC017936]|uniref:helix-turn-helix domain-containing protein n=1 Tax=Streptomyces sp. NPDC017936 TaxID=3365016 RepID=UPI0037B14C8D